MFKDKVVFSKEIEEATKTNKPIVALETGILTHDIEYPKNLAFAELIQRAIKEEGATPAYIFIKDGIIKVGLNQEELLEICNGSDIEETTSTNLKENVKNLRTVSTDVSACLAVCKNVGIKVAASNGVGALRRGINEVLNVLAELDGNKLCLISYGCKSIMEAYLIHSLTNDLELQALGYNIDHIPTYFNGPYRERKVNYCSDNYKSLATYIKNKWKQKSFESFIIFNTNSKLDRSVLKKREAHGFNIYCYSSVNESFKSILQTSYCSAVVASNLAKQLCH